MSTLGGNGSIAVAKDALRHDFLVGQTLGHYLVVERIGQGGMGVVYRAEDLHLDNRPVAIKILPQGSLADDLSRQRFRNEAQALAKLHHPNIATVIDFDSAQDLDFLVQELVQGVSLDEMLLSGPLSEKETIALGYQLCEALAAAHERGLIHRDIKPGNIRVTPDAHLKVLDFGLAKSLHAGLQASNDTGNLSETQIVLGTLPYVSPEQLLNKKLDGRTDIWAAGCVLYEMATGRRPFLGQGAALIDEILNQPPALPSKLNQHVSPGLEAIILKCLEKDPSLRYASARDVSVDLRRMSATTSIFRPHVPPKRRRWQPWLAVLAVLLIALPIAYWRVHRRPVLPERGWVLISDFDTSGDSTIPDKGILEALTISLEQSRYINVFPRSRAYEVLQRMKKPGTVRIDEALGREICQRENLQLLLTGSIERIGQTFQISVRAIDPVQGNLLFAEQERFDRQDQFFDKADQLTTRIRHDLGESLDRIAKSSRPLAKVTTTSLQALQLYSQAMDASDQGKDEQVEDLLKGALQLDPDFAMAHLRLGQYYLAVVGKNQRAAEELERAYRLRLGVTEREQRRIEAGYYSLHEQYDDEAQSLSILVSLYPDDEEAHQELADAYYDLDQLDKAVAEVHEVLRLNPNSSSAYESLVLFLAYMSQPEAAVAADREAQLHGAESPRIHWGLGLAYLALNNVSAARDQFQLIGHATDTDRDLQQLCIAVADLYEGKLEAAKTALNSQLESVSPETGGLQTFRRYLLGRIYLTQDNPHAAAHEADLILQVPSSGLQVSDVTNAGMLYARAGSPAKSALPLRLMNDSRKAFPSSSTDGFVHFLEGEIALAQGHLPDAEKSFRAATQDYPNIVFHVGLARTYQAEQRYALAASEWQQVLAGAGEILHHDFPPDLAFAHIELARADRQLNRPDLARDQYQQALAMLAHADDFPLLRQARSELKELTPPSARKTSPGPVVSHFVSSPKSHSRSTR